MDETRGVPPWGDASVPVGMARVPAAHQRTLLVNGLANVGGAIVPIPMMLLLVPYAIAHIGPAGYGAWALVSTLAAGAQLADFGIAAVVTRHIAFYHAAGERETVAEVVHSATALYLVIGAALMLLSWSLWSPIAALFFRGAGVPLDDVRFVFLASMTVFAATFAISGYASLLEGLQRLVYANALRSVGAVASGLVTFALLAAGHGLRAMVAGPVAALAVRAIGLGFLVPRLYVETTRRPLRLRRTRIAEITGFSSRLSLVQLSGFGHYQLPKLYLGLLAPIAAVGAYEIAASQMQRVQNLVTGLIYPFLPALAATARDGEDGVAAAASLYRLAHRFLGVLLLPFVAAVLVFSHRFVELWLGHVYESLGTVFVLAGLGTAALMLTAPAHYLLIGYQRLRFDVERSLLGLAVTVVGVAIGAKAWGVVGATGASTLAAVLAATWLYSRARSIAAVRFATPLLLADYGRLGAAVLPAAVAAAATLRALPTSWGAFVLGVLVFVLVLAGAGTLSGALRPGELRVLLGRRVTGAGDEIAPVIPR